MTSGLLNMTIEPTGKLGRFKVTEYFTFEGKPAAQEYYVYDNENSDAYYDAVHSVTRDNYPNDNPEYLGSKAIVIYGKTYYVPLFDNN